LNYEAFDASYNFLPSYIRISGGLAKIQAEYYRLTQRISNRFENGMSRNRLSSRETENITNDASYCFLQSQKMVTSGSPEIQVKYHNRITELSSVIRLSKKTTSLGQFFLNLELKIVLG
jgi:hypothetical protein